MNYEKIFLYYNDGLWSSKLKFKVYMRKQKAIDEICERFDWGSQKYCKRSKTGVRSDHSTQNKFHPPPPTDNNELLPGKTIIAFGDATFNTAMKGKKSGPLPSILKALKKYSNSKFSLVMVNEYLTSQICNSCKKKNLENLVDQQSKRRVHSVLKCKTTTCNTVWNRDIMAAKNILDVFAYYVCNNNNYRLTPFKRSEAAPI